MNTINTIKYKLVYNILCKLHYHLIHVQTIYTFSILLNVICQANWYPSFKMKDNPLGTLTGRVTSII